MSLLGVFASIDYLLPAQLTQARVTKVIGDIVLLPAQGKPRPASVNDDVQYGTRVRTGPRARAELILADQTIARLGANTIFNLNSGRDTMELGRGVMLLEVPKGVESTKINAGVAASAISGTVMLKYDSNYLTLIVLQGKARLSVEGAPHKGIVLWPGQRSVSRVSLQLADLGDAAEIDLKRLMDTSLLVKEFPRLAGKNLIDKQVQRQLKEKARGELVGSTTLADVLADDLSTVDQATTARSQSLATSSQVVLPLPQPQTPPLPPQTILPPPTPSPAPPSPSPTPAAASSLKAMKARVATDGHSPRMIALPIKDRGIDPRVREALWTDRRLMILPHTGRGR